MQRFATLVTMAALLGACGVLPDKSGSQGSSRAASQSFAVSPQGRQCLSSLGASGSRFSALPDKYYGAGCSTLNAVTLASLQGDRSSLAVSNLGPVTCPTAEALSGWARYGVDRAARQILGSPLRQIETMGSYACRNVAGSSRRSAHSRAEAIDVSGFVLEDGRRISVLADWHGGSAAEKEFLRIVQRSACKRFGTVLGPNYNAAHRDHFHLEWGNSSFCR
ncbi:extensin family protein [Parerythrobacter jejuensis]|uniref:Extensin n=1 Tax=Parerythrobacter jejuensis TaxID=795812 RepID=A0A845B1R7_9SPHN|nr:extensin family protein [Parerythrobacter jejuensis]MXP32928.1 extensin [Parerythrobacter jejuensis]